MSNSPQGEERLTILANSNTSRGKFAAAAVHAALDWYGVEHRAVIVLGAKPKDIETEGLLTIHDAGRTEVEPGTATASIRSHENAPQRDNRFVVSRLSIIEAELREAKAEARQYSHDLDIADIMAVLRKHAQ